MSFSERLRALIDERGLMQKQVAIDLKIPVSTLGGYVQGVSEPDFDMLIKIADYFNVSIDYLLGHNIGIAYSEKETEILRIFRTFDDFQQDIFIEQGRAVMKVILLNKSPILSAED